MSIAVLSIDILANLAKFETEMRRASGIVAKAAGDMKGSFAGLGTVFAGNVLAAGAVELARSLVNLVPDLVKTVANFQDLEEKTGASAVALASMQTAADVAGISAGQVAGYMVKLTGALSNTNDETKGAGGALKALGLDLETFRQLAPEQQFQTIAERLALFKDGAGKTAVAIALLGKSGAEALPFFKELAANGLSKFITTEQIQLADQYIDKQTKLRSELRQMAQVAAVSAVPAIIALKGALADTARELLGVNDAAGKLDPTKIGDFARSGAESLGVLVDGAVLVAKTFKLIGTAIAGGSANLEAFDTGGEKAEKEMRKQVGADLAKQFDDILMGQTFSVRVKLNLDRNASTARNSIGIADTDAPQLSTLDFKNTDDEDKKRAAEAKAAAAAARAAALARLRESEQVRQAQLAKNLQAIDAQHQLERDAIAFQERYLKGQRDAGLGSLEQYHADRRALAQAALDSDLDRFASERAEQQAALDKTADPSKRIDTQKRIQEIDAQTARRRRQFAGEAVLDNQAQTASYRQLAEQVEDFAAQLLQVQGDEAGAAAIRTNRAIENARDFARDVGSKGYVDVDGLARGLRATDAAAEGQKRLAEITARSATQEERYLLVAEQRGAGLVETEQGVYAIRSAALAQLGELLAKTEALAVAATPGSPPIKFAEALRLEFERTAATVDPALTRLRNAEKEFAGALASGAENAILNFSDLRGVLKGLEQDLLRIATRTLITTPLQRGFEGLLQGFLAPASSTPGFAGVGAAPYAEGGWTGPAGVRDPVGVVHGQEFVFSAPATRLIGVDKLDRMHRDAKLGRMPGYAEGGYVGRPFRGERSSPGRQDQAVQVINNGAPVAAKAERTRTPDGRDLLKITLSAVAADIAGGGGPVASAMKSRGLSLSGNLARRG